MDGIGTKDSILAFGKKYRYLLLVLLLGIALMTLPQQEPASDKEEPMQPQAQPALQDTLAEILSHIQGAGKVRVLLTQARGEQILYQTDGDLSEEKERRDTVLITNAQREEAGLVRQVISPIYQGAIVLCQGADNANVRLSIVEAVRSVTGLTSDHITVLKMK